MTERPLLVFDFDGTLVNSVPVLDRLLAEFSTARGLPFDPDKMNSGYVDPARYDLGWGVPIAQQLALFEEYSAFLFQTNGTSDEYIPAFFDGLADQLVELADDYDLAVVTARGRKSFIHTLDHHRMAHYFPAYRTKCCAQERGYPIKPAPDALLCLLGETGHALDRVLMVGDTSVDILMAHRAGVKSLAVLWGAHDRALLSEAGATNFVDDTAWFSSVINNLLAP